MNADAPSEQKAPQPTPARQTKRWVFGVAMVLALAALSTWWGYPRYAAWRLARQLHATAATDEKLEILNTLITARHDATRDVLAQYALASQSAAYDRTHNIVLFIDSDSSQLHVLDRSGQLTWTPDEPADYRDATVIENIPECVTFAVTRRDEDEITLLLQAYRHSAIQSLTTAEVEERKAAGIWNTYAAQNGHPIEARRASWDEEEEEEFRRWVSGE